MVTPLAGVWIEIWPQLIHPLALPVTPLAGVWIEIFEPDRMMLNLKVTPLAGVWIEIYDEMNRFLSGICHSPCGSVD